MFKTRIVRIRDSDCPNWRHVAQCDDAAVPAARARSSLIRPAVSMAPVRAATEPQQGRQPGPPAPRPLSRRRPVSTTASPERRRRPSRSGTSQPARQERRRRPKPQRASTGPAGGLSITPAAGFDAGAGGGPPCVKLGRWSGSLSRSPPSAAQWVSRPSHGTLRNLGRCLARLPTAWPGSILRQPMIRPRSKPRADGLP